jgi:hypothetical protein
MFSIKHEVRRSLDLAQRMADKPTAYSVSQLMDAHERLRTSSLNAAVRGRPQAWEKLEHRLRRIRLELQRRGASQDGLGAVLGDAP